MGGRPGIKLIKGLLVGVGLAVAAGGVFLSRLEPSSSRNWKSDHARLPRITTQGEVVTIRDIRNFRTVDGVEEPAYYDKEYALSDLESVWLVVSVFNEKRFRGAAHTMLSFGFAGDEYLVISVEARKEEGESYSPFRGMFRKYEIIYVIGDERDLVLTRVKDRPDDVYLYPIHTTQEKVRELFVDMLGEAQSLHEAPQHYNTLTNNCTTKLRDHVNRVTPGRIPSTWRVLLPGYADALIKDLGLIESDGTMSEVRRRYWINERAERYADTPDFSARIREP